MLTQQSIQSIAVIKVNFMDATKKADRIAECRSKAYNREYRDGSIGVISELHDGQALTVSFTDNGTKDVTSHLKGADVNVRFTKEQWEVLNSRFHTMEAIGAYIEVVVNGNVEYGDLTVNGEEVQTFTIYAQSVTAVEPMAIARVGSSTTEDDFFSKLSRDKGVKSNRADAARSQARAARESVVVATRKSAKV
jgi:hypothetical protein